jgi:hypothetical protein
MASSGNHPHNCISPDKRVEAVSGKNHPARNSGSDMGRSADIWDNSRPDIGSSSAARPNSTARCGIGVRLRESDQTRRPRRTTIPSGKKLVAWS